MIQPERIQILNLQPEQPGTHVLYWMQAAQREHYNHALEYAILQANRLSVPLRVCFGLTAGYPGANLRHYHFMLHGLAETAAALQSRGIPFDLYLKSPEQAVVLAATHTCIVVVDGGYSRIQRSWRMHAASHLPCRLIQVETECIVPVAIASPKEEYSAATIRPKITRVLRDYLIPLRRLSLQHHDPTDTALSGQLFDPDRILGQLAVRRSVTPVTEIIPGAAAAQRTLRNFLRDSLAVYHTRRNDPTADGQSGLSPYLHFGQISPLEVALVVEKFSGDGPAAFLEELIIRRELSANFVWYNQRYDQFDGLPIWAQRTLEKHARDPRPSGYSAEQLEAAQTHDPYWNAAQRQMTVHGKMHGYMRMYWAKKILEWMPSPREAFATALRLNDTYELDGRDPNGYAGVAWAFGKHDRPWGERPVFGMVRYMNAAGLKRKFAADRYAERFPPDLP